MWIIFEGIQLIEWSTFWHWGDPVELAIIVPSVGPSQNNLFTKDSSWSGISWTLSCWHFHSRWRWQHFVTSHPFWRVWNYAQRARRSSCVQQPEKLKIVVRSIPWLWEWDIALTVRRSGHSINTISLQTWISIATRFPFEDVRIRSKEFLCTKTRKVEDWSL
jgi:hypothetical protein